MSEPSTAAIGRTKLPYTAAVLIPPEDIWEPIQAIRREHDPQIARWMPHVTLLYPFVEGRALAPAADMLRPVAEQAPRFRVRLAQFGFFIHSGRSATVWLRPDPAEPVVRLQSALLAVFPWCDDTSRFAEGFTPHLSVGRWGAHEAEAAAAELQASWRPLDWRVESVCLIARPESGEGPFAVRHVLPLAGER